MSRGTHNNLTDVFVEHYVNSIGVHLASKVISSTNVCCFMRESAIRLVLRIKLALSE